MKGRSRVVGSSLIVFVLFAGLFLTVNALLVSDESAATTTSGSCGDSATWEFDMDTKTMTISGTGTVVRSADWIPLTPYLEKVVFSDGITEIGDSAFSNYRYLTTVEFGSGLEIIRGHAFGGTGLTSIELPAGLKLIQQDAFWNCSIPYVEVPAGCVVEKYAFGGHTAVLEPREKLDTVLAIIIAAAIAVVGTLLCIYNIKRQKEVS